MRMWGHSIIVTCSPRTKRLIPSESFRCLVIKLWNEETKKREEVVFLFPHSILPR